MKRGVLIFFAVLTFQVLQAATYTVTTAGNGTTVDGTSLRWAITQANGAVGNKIHFNIAGAAPHTITITSALPTIDKDDIVIDGSTQPLNGGSGDPKIIIDGGNSVGTGIEMDGVKDGLVIYGIHIKRFTNYAINANASSSCIIGNGATGKRVVINACGNAATDYALYMEGGTVTNTFIGTDSTGNTAASNTGYGIYMNGSGTLTLGSSSINDRCVISNNTKDGIYLDNHDFSVIKGARIGTDYNGTSDFGNGQYGIYGSSVTASVQIGGTVSGEGNVISGNTSHGIYTDGADTWEIYGNKIGTDVNGTAALGNGGAGIYAISSSGSWTIGSATGSGGNVISANSTYGIYDDGGNSWIIKANKIGTDINGTADLGNTSHGIYFAASVGVPTVGGSAANEGNVISGNGGSGIYIYNGSDNSAIKGNKIGTDVNGTASLGNDSYGIIIKSGGSPTHDHTIGGTAAASDLNYIAYNGNAGISVDAEGGITTDANAFRRNSIFCNAQSGTQLGIDIVNNGNDGIAAPVITSADGSNVSGTSPASATVEVFLDDYNCGCQGKTYKATAVANGSGNWSVACASCFNGDVTATALISTEGTSEFSNCQTTGVLPIELLLFKANAKDGKVYLYWSTASETNNDYFTIERTQNGKTFESIGTLKGNGTSTQVLNYIYTDAEPLNGRSYYRLKQTDYDGKFEYSILVPVFIGADKPEFMVYPNPSQGESVNIFLSGVEDENAAVVVTDQAGRVVFTEIIGQNNGSFFETIPAGEKISAGIYFVTVKTNHGTFRDKLVVK